MSREAEPNVLAVAGRLFDVRRERGDLRDWRYADTVLFGLDGEHVRGTGVGAGCGGGGGG